MSFFKIIFCVVGFILLVPDTYAQGFVFDEFNIGVKAGSSKLNMETPKDFSESIREFENSAGLAIDLEFSRPVSRHWELGTELSRSVLKGKNLNPDFSAQGYHQAFLDPVKDPVEYNNRLLGFDVFIRWYLMEQDNDLNVNAFLGMGVGFIDYKSVFKYIDAAEDNIIFGKNTNSYYRRMSNMIYSPGAGVKFELSPKLYLVTTYNVKFVFYDFLDVVHNYDETGNRQDLLGVWSELKIGIFYHHVGTKKGFRGGKGYFPFAK
jgi:hypothetical protein